MGFNDPEAGKLHESDVCVDWQVEERLARQCAQRRSTKPGRLASIKTCAMRMPVSSRREACVTTMALARLLWGCSIGTVTNQRHFSPIPMK